MKSLSLPVGTNQGINRAGAIFARSVNLLSNSVMFACNADCIAPGGDDNQYIRYTGARALRLAPTTAMALGGMPFNSVYLPVPSEVSPPAATLTCISIGTNELSLLATNLVWGYGYRLESSSNMISWNPINLDPNIQVNSSLAGMFWATNFTDTNGVQLLFLPRPTNSPVQFYRLRVP